jgi:hypothetical protein
LGPALNDACKALGREYEVNLWCKDQSVRNFLHAKNQALGHHEKIGGSLFGAAGRRGSLFSELKHTHQIDSRVVVHQLSDFSQVFTGFPAYRQNEFLLNSIEVLKKLDGYQAPSAVKDLLQLIILYIHGGLYMDTSTIIPEPRDRPNGMALFKEGVSRLQRESSVRVPYLYYRSGTGAPQRSRIDTFKNMFSRRVTRPVIDTKGTYLEIWKHQKDVYTSDAIVLGIDQIGAIHRGIDITDESQYNQWQVMKVPAIDVWAMFAPQKSPCMMKMVKSYVTRATIAGISKTGLSTADAPKTFKEAGNLRWGDYIMNNEDRKTFRNTLIGSLIARSVYDGLCEFYPGDFDSGWVAIDQTKDMDKFFHVPELGIIKFYANSWRHA